MTLAHNILIVLCFFATAAGALLKAAERPNIVLLISDDDDYENFGFMGNKHVHTPTLDDLARRGTAFTLAHCPTPLCRSWSNIEKPCNTRQTDRKIGNTMVGFTL